MAQKIVVGVDEVGRGCLAGPVVAAAVAFPKKQHRIPGIDDSKLLSSKKREELSKLIYEKALYIGIGQVEAVEIDAIGIVAAVGKAMMLACQSFESIDEVFVDGPYPLGLEQHWKTTPVVRGDHLIYSISAASIVAKVYRDTLMKKLSTDYPGYGWEHNVGYGTKAHYAGIQTLDLTPLHRKTFIHI